MAEVSLAMIQEMLRKALAELAAVRATQREHTQRLGRIELGGAQHATTQAEQELRIDRLAERIERLEERSDLRDT